MKPFKKLLEDYGPEVSSCYLCHYFANNRFTSIRAYLIYRHFKKTFEYINSQGYVCSHSLDYAVRYCDHIHVPFYDMARYENEQLSPYDLRKEFLIKPMLEAKIWEVPLLKFRAELHKFVTKKEQHNETN